MSRGRVERAARSYVLGKFARAEANGHGPINLELVREGKQTGYRAVCSCGWTHTKRPSKKYAYLAAIWHVTEVLDVLDERKRLDGVEWSAAPTTARLLAAMKDTPLVDLPQNVGGNGHHRATG